MPAAKLILISLELAWANTNRYFIDSAPHKANGRAFLHIYLACSGPSLCVCLFSKGIIRPKMASRVQRDTHTTCSFCSWPNDGRVNKKTQRKECSKYRSPDLSSFELLGLKLYNGQWVYHRMDCLAIDIQEYQVYT